MSGDGDIDEAVDLDDLANRLAREHQRSLDQPDHAPAEWRAEAILTMARHHDRRVIPPLVGILTGPTVSTLEVHAAAVLADPGLHPALLELAAKRMEGDTDDEFWSTVANAIGRCEPGAASEAEQVEVGLLAALQTSFAESGMEPVDVALVGDYPETEITFAIADRSDRWSIWNFDEQSPASPATLDRAFTMYRLANIARWL